MGFMRRTPFKSQTHGTRRSDYPTMSEASKAADGSLYNRDEQEHGVLFYERGFFGVVWYENSTRMVRDLKNW